MRARIRQDNNVQEVKAGRIQEACARYSLGQTAMRQLAAEAGACVKVGHALLFNFTILDEYMDRISGDGWR